MAQQLQKNGYVVSPTPLFPPRQQARIINNIAAAIGTAPELVSLSKSTIQRIVANDPTLAAADARRVGGAFGACGHPSSFHDERIRILRAWIFAEVVDMFREYLVANPDVYIQMVPDRVLLRTHDTKVAGKSTIHRDAPPDDDEACLQTFGGWFSMSQGQKLCLVPGSHREQHSAAGFAPESAQESRLVVVPVPKGHLVLFDETCLHKVDNARNFVFRLFVGFKLVRGPRPIDDCMRREFITQAPVTLKSGQSSPMYPKIWAVNFLEKAADLVNIVAPPVRFRACEKRTIKSGKRKGETFVQVRRIMPSLFKLFKKIPFAKYDETELALYTPSRTWKPVVMGSDNRKIVDIAPIDTP
jgi:hypothetical protein